MADYPTGNQGIGKGKGKDGLSGRVVDSGLEGRPSEKQSVRRGGVLRNKAGQTGKGNEAHA